MHVLLVEDEHEVVRALVAGLRRAGLMVVRATTADQLAAAGSHIDVVLLDLGHWGRARPAAAGRVRRFFNGPLIAIAVDGSEADAVATLEAGADDYMTQPLRMAELLARMRAVRRRCHDRPRGRSPESLLMAGTVEIRLHPREVRIRGHEVSLTPTEFDVLCLLATYGGRVVPRSVLLEKVWGRNHAVGSRALDVHMCGLRAKLRCPDLIRCVRGVGYYLTTPDLGSAGG